ncbi:MAG: hypothetical protein WC459_04140 [Patescibacteria group bacterium]
MKTDLSNTRVVALALVQEAIKQFNESRREGDPTPKMPTLAMWKHINMDAKEQGDDKTQVIINITDYEGHKHQVICLINSVKNYSKVMENSEQIYCSGSVKLYSIWCYRGYVGPQGVNVVLD